MPPISTTTIIITRTKPKTIHKTIHETIGITIGKTMDVAMGTTIGKTMGATMKTTIGTAMYTTMGTTMKTTMDVNIGKTKNGTKIIINKMYSTIVIVSLKKIITLVRITINGITIIKNSINTTPAGMRILQIKNTIVKITIMTTLQSNQT